MRFVSALTLLLATSTRQRPAITTVSSFLLSGTTTATSRHQRTFITRGGAAASAPPTPSRDNTKKTNKMALFSTTTDEPTATTTTPVENFRLDYTPSPYTIPKISLDFNITPDKETIVTSTLTLAPNPSTTSDATCPPLILDGDATSLTLLSITMDDKPLSPSDYTVTPTSLIISNPGKTLVTKVRIHPETNTQLSGLYRSSGMYCTQCEAMGFRRVTYYLDRPDNMAVFESVRVEAPREGFPVLLSNGNLVEEGGVEDGGDRHYAVWEDPFPKPSYLFALVAGDLGRVTDKFTTASGREVDLAVYSEVENVNKLSHAMESLKKSMKWDEDVFGLEYDLNLYNIVAVNDFNMGAMENKGLNVFNTAYVLATPSTATDSDFQSIEGVIGHEYFHNWTGNRVTCRDWFQLTLKEGLTVFRDQEFSGDMMNAKSVKRIEDVRRLRAGQFQEDAGPMKHPIRPESYISMDNFYTSTVYSKGAEVIRMYQTLLSPAGFRKGMDLYFQRHDGTAVTCDDFLSAMADANDVDLSQFGRWYSTPGTPTVSYETTYENGTLTITLKQKSLSEVGPLHLPISVGVLGGTTGAEIVPTTVLQLTQDEQSFTFDNLSAEKVIPSILRDFSAPVKLQSSSDADTLEQEWSFLAAHDTDGFNKWEAGQKLYTNAIFKKMTNDDRVEDTLKRVEDAFGRTVSQCAAGDESLYSILAYALTMPTESTLSEELEAPIDPVALHEARGSVKQRLARRFQEEMVGVYDKLTEEMVPSEDGSYPIDAASMGRRLLRNTILDYLCAVKTTEEERAAAAKRAMSHFTNALGMTDKLAGLSALVSFPEDATPERKQALQTFYDDANGDPLVINKWFTVQALADTKDTLSQVKALTKHPDFTLNNPNRCRSLISAFTMNLSKFHDESGEGYKFVGEQVGLIDKLNPQVSSRVGRSLVQWRRYSEKRGGVMRDELERLKGMKGVSDDLFEIVSRGLK